MKTAKLKAAGTPKLGMAMFALAALGLVVLFWNSAAPLPPVDLGLTTAITKTTTTLQVPTVANDVHDDDEEEGLQSGQPMQQLLTKTEDVCAKREHEQQQRNAVAPGSVHEQLAHLLERIALEYSCGQPSKTFVRSGKPHFWGGWKLFANYLYNRNWVERTQPNRFRIASDLMMVSCLNNIKLDELKLLMNAISSARNEHSLASKRYFFEAVRDRFVFLRCDSREYFPETFLVRNRDQCLVLHRQMEHDSMAYRDVQWRTGSGLTISTEQFRKEHMPNTCLPSQFILPVMIQRQLPNIAAKGRFFLLISSYFPESRAWFFMGYFTLGDAPPQVGQLKRKLKVAAQQTHMVVHTKLQTRERGAFSLFGVDFAVLDNGRVMTLGVDCNAEVYSSVEKFGAHKVEMSKNLVKGMMDIAIASNLAANAAGSEGFTQQFTEFVQRERARLLVEEGELFTKHWELVYSDAPKFTYASEEVC